jgi:hypothetical protein
MTTATPFAYHPMAAHILILCADARDLTWSSLSESADRVEACERIATEIKANEDDWQAQLLNAIEAEDSR